MQTNGKTCCVHGLEELRLLKYDHTTQAIYWFNAIPIKIPMELELENRILKFVLKYKRLWIVKNILRKNKAGGIMLFNFKLYFRVTITQTI